MNGERSDIVISCGNNAEKNPQRNPRWFGTAVAEVTDCAAHIPLPFSPQLFAAIKPHLQKALKRRDLALLSATSSMDRMRGDVDGDTCQNTNPRYGCWTFDVQQSPPLVATFLESCDLLKKNNDLRNLVDKEAAYRSLRIESNRIRFQKVYDDFVREVCLPHVVATETMNSSMLAKDNNDDSDVVVYYQAFPCIRIVRPNEFSIGPHADVAYGHHPHTVNCYLHITPVWDDANTSALFLEDNDVNGGWRALTTGQRDDGRDFVANMIHQFYGAQSLHFTVENQTGYTRVSLDFRLVISDGDEPSVGGAPGYYAKCARDGTPLGGQLTPPDVRFGYPWTAKPSRPR